VAVMLSGIISATVQIFFAYRVWKLGRVLIVSIAIILIALMQSIAAITGATQFLIIHLDNSKLSSIFAAFAVWLAGSLICDVIIAVSMVYFLTRARTKSGFRSTDALITRLINNSVQSGGVTAVCAGVELILFLRFKDNTLHDVPFLMLGKLYTNTLLATLNARASNTGPTPTDESRLTDSRSWRSRAQPSTQESKSLTVQIDTVREVDVQRLGNSKMTHSEHDSDAWATQSSQTHKDPFNVPV